MANPDTLNELLKKALGEPQGTAVMSALNAYAAKVPSTVGDVTELTATVAITGSDTVDESDVLASINALETAVAALIAACDAAGIITAVTAE